MAVTFEDDGPGFVEPDRVFDAFYTTKPVGGGTGLGLSLVQRFITEGGGTIAAENRMEGGARLTIRLRAAAPPQAPRARIETAPGSGVEPPIAGTPHPASCPTLPQGSELRRVLIVEDEPSLRDIQRRFLAGVGIQSILAKDAAAAIAVLEREPCDAVVTDIRMPGEMDGLGLYAWIELHLPDLARRCLFVSGELAATTDPDEFGVPAERVLAKPFSRDAYVARVMAILEDVADPAELVGG